MIQSILLHKIPRVLLHVWSQPSPTSSISCQLIKEAHLESKANFMLNLHRFFFFFFKDKGNFHGGFYISQSNINLTNIANTRTSSSSVELDEDGFFDTLVVKCISKLSDLILIKISTRKINI